MMAAVSAAKLIEIAACFVLMRDKEGLVVLREKFFAECRAEARPPLTLD